MLFSAFKPFAAVYIIASLRQIYTSASYYMNFGRLMSYVLSLIFFFIKIAAQIIAEPAE